MIKILQSEWTATVVGSVLYCLTLALTYQPPAPAPVIGPAPAVREKYSISPHDPEIDQLINELKTRKAQIDQREAELNELAARLKSERQELDVVTQTVFRTQQQFDSSILRLREAETANLKKLSKVYTAMAPEAAAAILKTMDDDTVAKILRLMKDSETAPIFEVMSKPADDDAKRVARIAERMRVAVNDPSTNSAASNKSSQ